MHKTEVVEVLGRRDWKGRKERGRDRRREGEGGAGQGRTQNKQARKDQVP